ncbi:MAG: glycosyltransferase family 4 protein [Thermoleophilia bacterium]|nr:glycosyltransferase family 4 protein [Thermoleophilia bacterium]
MGGRVTAAGGAADPSGGAAPLRVGLDMTALALTRAGTARYLRNLLARLAGRVEVRAFRFGGPGRASVLARELVWYPHRLGRVAARDRVDVLHCPTYYAPVSSHVPTVVTVHDLAVWRHPEAFGRWTRAYVPRAVPRMLRAAARVIAVSEFTRGELVELVGLPDEKIRVVPNAVEEVFSPQGDAAEGEYVLAVGTLEPRKNLERLADAARRVGRELRVAGEAGWGGVRLDGVRWLGRVDDEELARLYRGALCVAYPSLYEGFGIPVLEAMACGAPVVTSCGGATEEVAGGAAVLVDPYDPEAIAAGIEEAIARRDELRARGLERARAFSWDETARRTIEVYREVSR